MVSGAPGAGPYREETYSVSELCGEIRELVAGTFPEVWVSGEIQRLKSSRAGHLYFELIEKGTDDDIVGKLDVAVWRTYNRQVQARLGRAGAVLAEGQEIRCLGRVDFYERGGRLQLIVSDIDPAFTLGRLELRRRETIEALRRAGLTELNKGLALPRVPLDVALVTSHESAAYHDFLSTLTESPYGFRVTFIHASVQGAPAEGELASALRLAAELPVDSIALVRGGGSRADLAVFDSRGVAEAVARAERPVLAGLGHETDQSVVDLVAHAGLKTPTKVAEFLVERVAGSETRLDRIGVDLRHHALGHLRGARELLGRAEGSIERVRLRLSSARKRWEYLGQGLRRASSASLSRSRREQQAILDRLAAAAPRLVDRRGALPQQISARLLPAARRRLVAGQARIEAYERLCAGLAPSRVLRRGFSITRDDTGRVVRQAAELRKGARIKTQLADGEVASRVEET